jgi:prepilin-type N-terminal cleavage/methylation domain-containing protein
MNRSHTFPRAPSARAGFTLVEVLVALIILTVGVLGLAGTTALAVRQVTVADITAERATALQSVIERLRSQDYGDLAAGSDSIGRFDTRWTVTEDPRSKEIEIVTIGPGVASGAAMSGLGAEVADTFVYRIVRP